jgi:hypothetical protein
MFFFRKWTPDLGVDDEESTERNAKVLDEHPVIARNLLRRVGHQRNRHVPKPSLKTDVVF